MKKTLLRIALVLVSTQAMGQNSGEIDPTFGTSGWTLSDPFVNTGEKYWDAITLPDDKILKVGYTKVGNALDVLVARFKADGIADSTFDMDGFLRLDISIGGNEDARGVCVLPNGDYLITGYVQTPTAYDAYVMKIKPDGTVDANFGTNGGYTNFNTGLNSIAYGKSVIFDNNEIYVGGAFLNTGNQSDLFIANLSANGTIDASFSSSGYAKVDIEGGHDHLMKMGKLSNGTFILGGYADSSGVILGYVTALSSYGTPTTFGTNGKHKIKYSNASNEVNDFIIEANDQIVLVGDAGTFPNVDGFIQRLNPNGTLDNTFGVNGYMMSDPGASIALFFRGIEKTLDGNYLCVGNYDGAAREIHVLCLRPNGMPYSGFAGGVSYVSIPLSIMVNSLAIMGSAMQSSGKLVVAGYLTSQDFVGENQVMARIITTATAGNNELDSNFIKVYPNPSKDVIYIDGQTVKSVQLIDFTGKICGRWENTNQLTLPNDVINGMYFLSIEGNHGFEVVSIQIQK